MLAVHTERYKKLKIIPKRLKKTLRKGNHCASGCAAGIGINNNVRVAESKTVLEMGLSWVTIPSLQCLVLFYFRFFKCYVYDYQWAVLTSTHRLCFRANIRNNVYLCSPQFHYIKVGCKGYKSHGYVIQML